ncbi:MAG TPA: YfhO family protein [Chthoniobacterales bacterium]|nr:YfhO family protein [Chthoniobacterales bacterium]
MISDSIQRHRWTWLTALALVLVGAFIFRQFLFGDAVLLYTDIGSDSVNDYYPSFVHLSDYIRAEGVPSWSFSVGMGQDLAYAAGYLVWQPVSWLSRALIAPALVYQHLAKVLLAGLLFLRFLQLRQLQGPAPFLGAFLLSFSAYMCTGSCWYPFADEVVCFAAILLGAEEALQRGRWIILAAAVALVGMITPFHLYLCALFVAIYVPARAWGQSDWRLGQVARVCLPLSAIALLGVALGAIITLPVLDAIFHSPRGSGTTSSLATLSSSPLFRLESAAHYISALTRLFSNDLIGTGDDFRGWQNYLEAPLTYCGLICLVLFPQIFPGAGRRQRIVYLFYFLGMVLPVIFPWFRYLFWLFQGDYYRAHSLFSVLGMITLGMMVLSRYSKGQPLKLWLLAPTIAGEIALLYWPLEDLQVRIDQTLKLEVTVFLLLYGALLTIGQLIRRQGFTAWAIAGVAIVELCRFDQITVSNRKTVSKQDLTQRVDYNDFTLDAVRDIKAEDPGFFRLTKLRPSGPSARWASLNDAEVFGYYGTSSYSSFNSVNYTDFLTAVDAITPRSEAETRWSIGLLNDPMLSLFAGEKYALVEDPAPFQRAVQYELVRRYDRDYLFRNARFVPFGLTFHRYISPDAFLRFRSQEKPEVLLRVAVLSDNSEADKLGLVPANLSDLEDEIRNSVLKDLVLERRRTGLEMTNFRQTHFAGTVQLEQKSVLVLQTPFAPGWHASQDGKPVPVFKVDMGLLGVALDAGSHKVELSYRNACLIAGAAITLASLLLMAVAAWKWPRLSLPSGDGF